MTYADELRALAAQLLEASMVMGATDMKPSPESLSQVGWQLMNLAAKMEGKVVVDPEEFTQHVLAHLARQFEEMDEAADRAAAEYVDSEDALDRGEG